MVEKKKSVTAQLLSEQRRKHEEERQKLIVQVLKVSNGATLTKLKPAEST